MTPRKDRNVNGRYYKGGRKPTNHHGYVARFMPWHPNASKSGMIYEHIWVMSRMLGSPVPAGMHVHHMDGDKTNNSPSNLMLCDMLQHKRMHVLMDAFAACGDPARRKCRFCKQYDDTARMTNHGRGFCHKECRSANFRTRAWRYKTTKVNGKNSNRLREGVVSRVRRKSH